MTDLTKAKAPRKFTTTRRIDWYLGPDKEIRPEELDFYEKTGQWLTSPKVDGMWCCLTVGNPRELRPNTLKSRDARTGEILGDNAGTLREVDLTEYFPEGAVPVGELEAASQWATQQANKRGYRRMHLFDLVRTGEDIRDMTTEDRYRLLASIHEGIKDPAIRNLFPLVPVFYDRFRERYEQWLKEGYEGCVIKRRNSPYRTTRMDGKTNEWLRCKKHVTEDYVLMGVGLTPGGKTKTPGPIGIWGLHVEGVLKPVMRAGCPPNLYDPKHFGILVAEFMGWEAFVSGSLRHAQFVRVRTDKPADQCVLRAEEPDASTSPFPVLTQPDDLADKF